MQWATYDLETRHDDFQELFRKVDLSLLPIEYLEDVISHEVNQHNKTFLLLQENILVIIS